MENEKSATDKLLDDMEIIQAEMHKFIDEMKETERGKSMSYDALKDCFYIMKIATLENKVK